MRLGIESINFEQSFKIRGICTTLELEAESAFPSRYSPLYEVFSWKQITNFQLDLDRESFPATPAI